ncbi:MAG: hypothetical protein AB1918_07865 [Pseudomonadota bacterium]
MADLFRARHRQLTAEEAAAIARVKALAEDLWGAVETGVPDGREKALARTNLEQTVMWAVKGITG